MSATIIEALSGLGMFLFGMLYMEAALKEAAGAKFKRWIKDSTSTIFKSLLTGAGATALLQSSSVITLMTLSFVSASLMSLHSGIAVIFGSNLGTTATAWIVATLGFKLKIEAFALPMIGAGGLILILAGKSRKLSAVAKIAVGFGLLFLGLDIMKGAIESFATTIDLAHFSDYPLIVFVGIGFLLTALIQSSSAATAIVLSALYAQILTFEQSAAMVIGTNIGTTVTAMLGAIGGIPDKKRAAAAHLIFNVVTAIVAFLLLPYLSIFVLQTLHMENDLTTALALFHTIFNLLGIMIMTPFIGLFARWLKTMFHYKKPVPTKYIHLVDVSVPEGALIALRDEAKHLFNKTMKYGLLLANIRSNDFFNKEMDSAKLIEANKQVIDFDYKKAYDAIKDVEIQVVDFATRLNQQPLNETQIQYLDMLLISVRDCVYAAKVLKDIKKNLDEFAESDNYEVKKFYDAIRRNMLYVFELFNRYITSEWDEEKCITKFTQAERENTAIMKKVTASAFDRGHNEKMIVSLLNTNRSIYMASQSLLEASKAAALRFAIEEERAS